MKIKQLFLGFTVGVLLTSCDKFDFFKSAPQCASIDGSIKKLGVTTFMYGTHIISDTALISSDFDLDEFLFEPRVIVEGCLIKGYPLNEGDPYYLEVTAIAIP